MSGENIPAPLASFEHPAIPESLQKNIVRCQYKRPTPVQKYGISIALEKRDLMACAQTGTHSAIASSTGSGKTAAYLFPLIAAMINSGPSKTNLPAGKKYYPTAVVLCPTRELASQIHQEAERVLFPLCCHVVLLLHRGCSFVCLRRCLHFHLHEVSQQRLRYPNRYSGPYLGFG